MDKSTKKTINEVIENLIKLRKEQFDNEIELLSEKETIEKHFGVGPMTDRRKILIEEDDQEDENPFNEKYEYIENYEEHLWSEYLSGYDTSLVKLNNLLETEDKYSEVSEIEEHMIKIQTKKIISVREYTEIYGDSAKAQENDRNREKNKLPYHQKVEGGKIKYHISEIEEWREKYNHR